jgi:hypothetical protein
VRLEPRPPDLTAKDRQHVAEHENLQLLRSITSPDEHDQLQQATDDNVEADTRKGDLQQTGKLDATRRPRAALAPHPIRYLHPTGVA